MSASIQQWRSPLLSALGAFALACAAPPPAVPPGGVAPVAGASVAPAAAGPAPAAPGPSQGAAPPLLHPRASTPWLGVELKARAPEQAGVLVSLVMPRSPAARAGVEEGDVLLSLDGQAPAAPLDVSQAVQKKAVGESLALLVQRAGAQHLLRAELDGLPEFEDRVRLAFVGMPAPEIAGVTTFQGETSALSEVRGQVVVLEFWASWCGPCRYVSPILDRWYREYRPLGAQVIGITVDSPSEGVEVARRTGMSYTLAHDPAGRTTRSYLASQVPMLVLIDKAGRVRDVMVGSHAARLEDFERQLRALLEEPS